MWPASRRVIEYVVDVSEAEQGEGDVAPGPRVTGRSASHLRRGEGRGHQRSRMIGESGL